VIQHIVNILNTITTHKMRQSDSSHAELCRQMVTKQATKELSTVPKAQKCQVATSYRQYIFIIF